MAPAPPRGAAFPARLSPAHRTLGAMELPSDRTCPVCGRNRAEAAYVTPCRHQLCLGCALRWAKQHRTCAVCKESIEAVRYAVQSEEDFLACPIPQPAGRSEDEQEEEQGSAEPQLEAPEHSFPAETWADFFRGDPGDLEPLLRWIQQELEDIIGEEWWTVAAVRADIMHLLCLFGLSEDTLSLNLESYLEDHTGRVFVAGLIDTVTALYGPALRRQQDNQAAHETGGQDGPAATPSPATSPQEPPAPSPSRSTSPASPGAERLPGVPHGGPEPRPAAPVSPQEPQEQPGQAVAAGPSAQGTDHQPGGPRRPPRRRASSCPPDLPPSPKRRR